MKNFMVSMRSEWQSDSSRVALSRRVSEVAIKDDMFHHSTVILLLN
jgi:hypothetical protein